jgi:YesN/AraC family two-component response regulator
MRCKITAFVACVQGCDGTIREAGDEAFMQLMIVDDEEYVREVIGESVSDLFESVIYAADGIEAYQKIFENRPDVIISDFNMPKLDGLELLKLLGEQNLNIPIIWLTGRGTHQIRKQAWAFGVYDYFEKPFDVEAIRECLEGVKMLDKSTRLYELCRSATKVNFEQISLLLEKPTFKAFHDRCLEEGTSATSKIQQLIEGYLHVKE